MNQTVPGFVAESWVGMLAPARTPAEIIARRNAEIGKALSLPDVKERFAEQGFETVGEAPAELDKRIRSELQHWGRVIRAANIALE